MEIKVVSIERKRQTFCIFKLIFKFHVESTDYLIYFLNSALNKMKNEGKSTLKSKNFYV